MWREIINKVDYILMAFQWRLLSSDSIILKDRKDFNLSDKGSSYSS